MVPASRLPVPGPVPLVRRLLLLLAATVGGLALLAVGPLAAAQPAGGPRVLATTVDDAITPVIADHLTDGVERAAAEGYDAFLVELDTPGGLDTSMRDIVQSFLGAGVPVIVWVSPAGARAGSAGAIITFAAHVAAMAPATAIGAATPVDLESGEVADKIVNDAAAYARALAELRGRNADFAADTVRKGRSAPAEEAVDIGAVDLLATNRAELLEAVDGTTVTLGDGREVELRTAGAAVDRHDMGLFRSILQFLADPNIAFLLLSVGTLGLIYELASPGVGVGGVVGLIFILLALVGLSVLPINAAGLVLLALAAALFVAELFVPGIGLFAVLGAVALVLSGLFLFRDEPGLNVSLSFVLPVAAVVGVGVVLAGRIAMRSRTRPARTTGAAVFEGKVITVERVRGGEGQAFVEGAWWRVRNPDAPLEQGQHVRVTGVEGLVLLVEPLPVEAGPAGTEANQGG